MENTGFLRTVSFGGYDKRDVLTTVDSYNTRLYTIKAILDKASELLTLPRSDSRFSEKYRLFLAECSQYRKITQEESSPFLKTVSFGGFDKDDVTAYCDDLRARIYSLEEELDRSVASVNDRMNEDYQSDDVTVQTTALPDERLAQLEEKCRKQDDMIKELFKRVEQLESRV